MKNFKLYGVMLLILISQFTPLTYSYGEVIERVVAVVDDDVILLSELKEELKANEGAGEIDLLNLMVERMLLLREARKFRFHKGGDTVSMMSYEDEMIAEYKERRIRAFINIPFDNIENYYYEYSDKYAGKEFYEVKDGIEDMLIEEKFEGRLAAHIRELREQAYVRMQY